MSSASSTPGPLAQLRHAAESPLALILGAALGGLVPASTYVVAHVGELVRVEGGGVLLAPWHPGWVLVLGGLLFSGKTVYAWTRAAFEDRAKALGFVVLVEGVLLLSPSPALSYVALGYLVVINALGTGAALALRDRGDHPREAAANPPQPEREKSPRPVRETSRPTLPAVSQPAPPAVPKVKASASLPAVLTADTSRADGFSPELYQRAEDFVRARETITTEDLKRELRCRQPMAAALLRQLAAEGLVGEAVRGRRPVLNADSARGSAQVRASAPLS
jgi:ribosomal protein S25